MFTIDTRILNNSDHKLGPPEVQKIKSICWDFMDVFHKYLKKDLRYEIKRLRFS